MAVRAANFALVDLIEDYLQPGPSSHERADRVQLFASHMIELENPNIAISAVDAAAR